MRACCADGPPCTPAVMDGGCRRPSPAAAGAARPEAADGSSGSEAGGRRPRGAAPRPGTAPPAARGLKGNWAALWAALDRDHCHAGLIWNEATRAELREALQARPAAGAPAAAAGTSCTPGLPRTP
jgi:hypothetical protein